MKKLLKPFIVLSAIFVLYSSCVVHRYHVLEWDSAEIKSLLDSPKIDQFVFNFNKSLRGRYGAFVSAFDSNGVFLRDSKLSKTNFERPPLKNIYTRGLFFVRKDTIVKYSNDGADTLYFNPIPYNDGLPYVSYEIYNAKPESGKGFLKAPPLTTLNPSPPKTSQ
ncbi:MAG: hypothetical protein ABIN97_12395 [Ginsengibacter sp.]